MICCLGKEWQLVMDFDSILVHCGWWGWYRVPRGSNFAGDGNNGERSMMSGVGGRG